MDAIRAKHSGLIDGLNNLFDLLVTMRYIAATDVRQPPHTSPPVDVARMSSMGFDTEAIELSPLLPQLRNGIVWGYQEEGVELLPRSKAVNYLDQGAWPGEQGSGYPDLFEDLRLGNRVGGEDAERFALLPPTMLRLTHGGSWGVHLLYDVTDQTLTEYTWMETTHWNDLQRRPAATVLNDMVSKLARLDWVPHYDPADKHETPVRQLVDNPAVMANEFPYGFGRRGTGGAIVVPLDDDAAVLALARQAPSNDDVGVAALCERINEWRSRQKLYRDAGWHGGSVSRAAAGAAATTFDGDTYERLRAAWLPRRDAMEFEWGEKVLAVATRGPAGAPATQEELQASEEFSRRYEAFWKESAGEHYVSGLS